MIQHFKDVSSYSKKTKPKLFTKKKKRNKQDLCLFSFIRMFSCETALHLELNNLKSFQLNSEIPPLEQKKIKVK